MSAEEKTGKQRVNILLSVAISIYLVFVIMKWYWVLFVAYSIINLKWRHFPNETRKMVTITMSTYAQDKGT